MGAEERPAGRPLAPDTRPIAEIVPARAVLTELARGFLLTQGADPARAKRFASSFLKEAAGPPGPGRIVPMNRRPTVHRGLEAALDRPSSGWP